MDQAQYTLPGVMHFLRTEWQQREKSRIEWEIERADLRSRINKLESEKSQLQNERDALKRHLNLLVSQLKTSEANNNNTDVPSNEQVPEDEQRTMEVETNKIQSLNDDLLSTVSDSQEYIAHCLSDIKQVLQQCGVATSESDRKLPSQTATSHLKDFITLANFGKSALSILVFSDNRVAAGTADGDLLVWASGATEARKFGENANAVKHLAYNEKERLVFAAVGSQVQVFDVSAFPKLVSSTSVSDIPIADMAASPAGDMLAIVLSDGTSSTWSRTNDGITKKVDSSTGCRSCGFADIDDNLHLVLARNANPIDPENADVNLLLADPLTGRLLKKIVITSFSSISVIRLTPETIVLGTDSGDLRVLGLARGDTLAEVTAAHQGQITSLTLLNEGKTLITTSIDGRSSLWSLPGLLWKGRFLSHDSGFGALCSAANSTTSVIGGGDGLIRVYRHTM